MKTYNINKDKVELDIGSIKKTILLELAATAMLANLKLRKQKS